MSRLQSADMALPTSCSARPPAARSASSIRSRHKVSTLRCTFRMTGEFLRSSPINLGIRWDLQRGNREKWGRIAWFDPECRQPHRSSCRSAESSRRAALGQRREWPQSAGHAAHRDFAPRIGVAYRIHRQVCCAQRLWPFLRAAEHPGQRPGRDHGISRYADGDKSRQQHHASEPALESLSARRPAAAE